jgi:regulatory protein
MAPPRGLRQRPPLDSNRLEELALRYVARFATSRAKLRAYLSRKVRERGWSGSVEPDLDGLADKICRLGYVDDAAYALSKAQSLSGRGYGKRRLSQKLQVDGIGEEDAAPALDHADSAAVESALRFARRRRLGPFGAGSDDPKQREKAIAAMIRAGHPFGLSRAIAVLAPDADIDPEAILEQAGYGAR